MQDFSKIKIGISIGDCNGIGLEVIIKTLLKQSVLKKCTPIIYASSQLINSYSDKVKIKLSDFITINSIDSSELGKVNILNCWQEDVQLELGKSTPIGGKYSLISLQKSAEDLKLGKIDALVTAPINKNNIQAKGFHFPGHTEYLADIAGCNNYLMFLVNPLIKVGTVTGHIPIKDVSKAITKEAILTKLLVLNNSLVKDFNIKEPKIAVLGLNPHAGDNGLLGKEEIDVIIPAIELAKRKGIKAIGPIPADGFFGSESYKKQDAILSMYHDQGLIPFKTLSFSKGVNFTAGLPFVRTSPDHGTAYEIAGKNLANESSFTEALLCAVDIVKNRGVA